MPANNTPPPGPQTNTSATHEPTGMQHPPPRPTPPLPPPPAPARMMTCDDATQMAMRYAADHQMGPMELQNCHVEDDGRVLRVFLKGDKHGEHHGEHGDKRQLKIKFDARDGHVLEAKEDEKDKDDDDQDHGKGHGKQKEHEKGEHEHHDD